MTVAELIASALRLSGALAPGQSPNADELADAFAVLNMLVGGWSAEGLLYQLTSSEQALAATKAAYKIGPAAGEGEWVVTSRPLLIRAASVKNAAGISNQVEVVDASKWAGIPDKSETAQLIRQLYCDYAYPIANILVWPVPAAIGTLTLHAFFPLAEFANTAAEIALPAGFTKALRYNLARDLAPEYGRTLDQNVAAIATETKATLKALAAQTLAGSVPAVPAPGA
jgi:hypothetical protein